MEEYGKNNDNSVKHQSEDELRKDFINDYLDGVSTVSRLINEGFKEIEHNKVKKVTRNDN